MTANELMVGDWVLWKDKPVQIARVSGVVYSFGHIDVTLAHCGSGVLETHDIKSISPIPLTTEILEKNEIDTVFKTRYKGFYLEYHAEVGMIMLYVYNNGSFQPTGVGFKYVHELQHALRLCGIDKEIIIKDN